MKELTALPLLSSIRGAYLCLVRLTAAAIRKG
jgi:hypothetical protein